MSLRVFTFLFLLGLGAGLWCVPAQAQKAKKTDPANLTQFIGPDFCAAIVVHPSRILKSPLGKALELDKTPELPGGMGSKKLPVEPSKVRRVVILLEATPVGTSPVSPAAIIQFDEDVDAKAILAEEWPDLKDAKLGEIDCFRSESKGTGGIAVAAYAPGPRTLLVALEPTLEKMVTPSEGPRPLLDQLRRSSLNNDVVVEILVEPLVKLVPPSGDGGPKGPLDPQAILQEIKSGSLVINFTGDMLAKLTIVGAKEDSADKINGMFTLAKMLASQQIEEQKNKPQDPMQAMLAPLIDLGGQLLKGLKVSRQSDAVVVSVKMPENFAEMVKKAQGTAGALVPLGMPGPPPGIEPPPAPGKEPEKEK
jgi:hypothetical protein